MMNRELEQAAWLAARKSLRQWAAVNATRDERIISASAAGVGVNEITRLTGLAKTTVLTILRRYAAANDPH
jgi:hypothetical protein